MTCISLNFEGDFEISFLKIKACGGFSFHFIAGNPGGYM
jgi:hypothetical protein